MSDAVAIAVPVTIVALIAATATAAYLHFIRKGPALTAKYKLLGLSKPPAPTVVGFTAKGYEQLAELVRKEFVDGDSWGSQLAVYVKGELKVDIASGYTDTTYKTPYSQDNLQLVFSSSKFVVSAVVLHLINTGRIKLSDRVAQYWPEFGAGGKENVTIGQLMSHRSGVAFLDPERAPTPEDILDLDHLAQKIAGQPHNFDGKEVSAYHAVTRDWFSNEVIRRATGKTIRDIMYDEIMPLLNKDNTSGVPYEFHFGVPEDAVIRQSVLSRLTKLHGHTFFEKLFFIVMPSKFLKWLGVWPVPPNLMTAYLSKGTPQNNSLFKSGPDFKGRETEWPWCYNDETLLKGQSGSFGCLTNAHSLARLAEFVRRSYNGENGLVSKEVCRDSINELDTQFDCVVGHDLRMTQIGFGIFGSWRDLDMTEDIPKENVKWIGWAGAGGSMVIFSLEHELTFSYTQNFMLLQSVGDHRTWRLYSELMRILERGGNQDTSVYISS